MTQLWKSALYKLHKLLKDVTFKVWIPAQNGHLNASQKQYFALQITKFYLAPSNP